MLIKNKAMAKKKKDTFEIITDLVIEGLKKKGLEWFKPWTNENGVEISPVNHITGKAYKGINVFICYATAMDNEYPTNEWIGYKQATDMGYKVPKGGTRIYYWYTMFFDRTTKKWIYFAEFKKLSKGMNPDEARERFVQRMYPKAQMVWNIAQISEDIQPKWTEEPKPVVEGKNSEIDFAKGVYENMPNQPKLTHRGNQAYYRACTHSVRMPKLDTFKSSEDYYKVLYHELIHSTGEAMGRKFGSKFGDEKYSKEELVAEIGAMMVCAKVGVNPSDEMLNSQAYINGWVKYLKNHKKEVMFACSQAQKAVTYMLNEDNKPAGKPAGKPAKKKVTQGELAFA